MMAGVFLGKAMAELFLVRHGQASFGTDDYDRLSALGERQAEWLGEYFARRGLRFDRIMAGTMRRHRQTLAAIGRGLGQSLAAEEHPGLDEYDFESLYRCLGDEHGELKAMARGGKADFYRGLRQVLQLWAEDRLASPPPESWQQFQDRVAAVRRDIQQGGGQRVLVVSSGGVMGTFAQQVLQAPAPTAIALTMQLRNSSCCHYFFNARSCHLAGFNHLPHLDQPERLDSITYG